MSSETAHGPAFDVTVGDHRFRRNENGVVAHYIAGAPDHSANGLTTTLELFAEEILRLRERAGEEPGPPSPRARDPLGG
jgi:hypothetical protein